MLATVMIELLVVALGLGLGLAGLDPAGALVAAGGPLRPLGDP
jgi:hypothetical protein